MFDAKTMGEEVVRSVRDFCVRSIAPVTSRIDAVENQLRELPVPKDGKDADPEIIAVLVQQRVETELREFASEVIATFARATRAD